MAQSNNPYASPTGRAEENRRGYRTAPVPSTGMPGGIPYIICNEAAERFSFYGMRAILVVFMTKYLLDASGEIAPMSEAEARSAYHRFVSAAYFFPMLGALLSDAILGKYRTILALSLIYCLGHLALALDETRMGLTIGLTLIAVGSGGIKPCVSAHVGDQFGESNKHLLEKVFSWFYFSINLGAFISTLLTPILLEKFGPNVAFGVPGLLMFLATCVFWLGRRKFVHVPPGGMTFVRETFSGEGLRALGKLSMIYVFVIMFWALFDQTGSAWVLQAEKMDRNVFGYEVLASQIQAANPILIMTLIPIFSYVVYPAFNNIFPLTPLRRMSIGLFLTALSFVVCAWVEHRIQAGFAPTIAWQIFAYIIMTSGEVMVSITGLEFSYTQAPNRMKSVVMALFFLSVSLGNLFVSEVNELIQNEDGSVALEGPMYYWFFAAVMAAAAALFTIFACFYRERTYVQQEQLAS